jgi:hypothetical protein
MKKLMIALLFGLLFSPAVMAGFVYNASNDFTTANLGATPGTGLNPNGVWSYGSSATSNGVMNNYASSQYFINPDAFGFRIDTTNTTPNVLKFTQNWPGSGTPIFLAGDFAMHSGAGASNFSVLRFTAQHTGLHDLAVTWGVGNTGNVDVVVLSNAAVLNSVSNTNAAGSYGITNLSLTAGDTIDLRIGQGDDGLGADQTQVSMIITTAVPEPSSLACISGLVAGLSVLSRRRRQA